MKEKSANTWWRDGKNEKVCNAILFLEKWEEIMYVKVQSTVQSLYQRNKFKNAVTFHLKMVFIESFSIFTELL